MVGELVQKHGYSVRGACALLVLSPSSNYYRSLATEGKQIEADLKVVAGQHPSYGTHRLMHQLRLLVICFNIFSTFVYTEV